MCALRIPPTSDNSASLNKFEAFNDEPNQEYDSEVVDAFNYFAHKVTIKKNLKPVKKKKKTPKMTVTEDFPALAPPMPAPGTGCGMSSNNKCVVIKSSRYLDKLDPLIAAALPSDKKSLAK